MPAPLDTISRLVSAAPESITLMLAQVEGAGPSGPAQPEQYNSLAPLAPPEGEGDADVAAAAKAQEGGRPSVPNSEAGGGQTGEGALPDVMGQALAQNQASTTLTQATNEQPGLLHFIEQSDLVGKSLFVVLIVMSLISWYLIILKTLSHIGMKARVSRFLNRFWQAPSLAAAVNEIRREKADNPFSRVALQAIEAREHYARFSAGTLEDGSEGDYLTRAIRKGIDEETARLESGLTMLASIGSTAPFVGLFGTVWGVYHALVSIGMGGGATIDRIAGPVGEALIMTGLGLAVAIPAVLGFNAFVRRNRVLLARLDAFAYDLFTFLSTGQQMTTNGTARGVRREPQAMADGTSSVHLPS